MSFPKARILRFNEEMTCAPPPGKYDPKYDEKIKGAVIEKSKRFVDDKTEHHSSSLESLETISTSTYSAGCSFRTPQSSFSLHKRKTLGTPLSSVSDKGRYRKSVICKKSLDDTKQKSTVKDLMVQIEELTKAHSSQLIGKDQEILNLQTEITKLRGDEVDLGANSSEVEKLNRKLGDLSKEKIVPECDYKETISEVVELKTKLQFLEEKLKEVNKDKDILVEKIHIYKLQIEELSVKLENSDRVLKEKNEITEKLQKEYNSKILEVELLNIKAAQNQDLIDEMSETVRNLKIEISDKSKQITDFKEKLETSKATSVQIHSEYDRMKELYKEKQEECVVKSLGLREKEDYIKQLISELDFEKTKCSVLNDGIEKFKLKKNNIKNQLVTLQVQRKEFVKQAESLTQAFNELNTEKCNLMETNKDLIKKLSNYEESYQELEKFKGNIESKLKKINESCTNCEEKLVFLEKQLLSLKSINEMAKAIKLNETKLKLELNQLTELNKTLDEQIKNYLISIKELTEKNSNLSLQGEKNNEEKQQLYETVREKVKEIDILKVNICNLQNKTDELKLSEAHRFDTMKSQWQKELQKELKDSQTHLQEKENLLIQIKLFLLKWEKDETDKNVNIDQSENILLLLEQMKINNKELVSKIESLQQEKELFLRKNQDILEEKQMLTCKLQGNTIELQSQANRIAELESRNQELESIIGPFKDQLIQFENERSNLLLKNENTEKELKAVVLEQAKVLGHQNHKQKIKHVVYLTETVCNLKKEMTKLRGENNRLRARLLENPHTLKKTLLPHLKKEDKENSVEGQKSQCSSLLSVKKESNIPKRGQPEE